MDHLITIYKFSHPLQDLTHEAKHAETTINLVKNYFIYEQANDEEKTYTEEQKQSEWFLTYTFTNNVEQFAISVLQSNDYNQWSWLPIYRMEIRTKRIKWLADFLARTVKEFFAGIQANGYSYDSDFAMPHDWGLYDLSSVKEMFDEEGHEHMQEFLDKKAKHEDWSDSSFPHYKHVWGYMHYLSFVYRNLHQSNSWTEEILPDLTRSTNPHILAASQRLQYNENSIKQMIKRYGQVFEEFVEKVR